MKPERLLRWYPRSWRERYGEELLALIQDTVDEGRPAWRLRLSVAWGGLRERDRRAAHAASAGLQRLASPNTWVMMVWAGLIVATVPQCFARSSAPSRVWQTTAARDALLVTVALTGALVLAGVLAALPALVRLLRTGGWPAIRRRAWLAAVATAVSGGALAGLTLAMGSHSPVQLADSLPYAVAVVAAGLAIAAAMGLWAATATAAAKHLALTPRVRAAQLVLGAGITIAVPAMVGTAGLWWWASQPTPVLLGLALGNLAVASTFAPKRIRRAVRKGRRLRAAAGRRSPG
jgi:hypothetical protein